MLTTAARFARHYAAITLTFSTVAGQAADLVFFGTYTGGKSKGIYASTFDPASGKPGKPQLVAETRNPSFLAIHPNGRYLYAVGEVDSVGGKPGGVVSAFAIHPTDGKLQPLNQQSSGGGGPCHLVVDGSGGWVLVANYGGGSVATLPIRPDGTLGEAVSFIQHQGSSVNPHRQKGPHAHSINVDAANRFALAADLGLDKVLVYRFDPETGKLELNSPASATLPPGSGPRHLAFHPGGRHAFVINEMLLTLTALSYEAETGVLRPLITVSTLPPGSPSSDNNSTAEVRVHPSGRFVYGSNRGHNSIAVFRFDERNNQLTLLENEPTQGRIPRNFGIDPAGRWLLAANQDSDTVVVFSIDPESGLLTPTGDKIEVGTPVCVKFLKTP